MTAPDELCILLGKDGAQIAGPIVGPLDADDIAGVDTARRDSAPHSVVRYIRAPDSAPNGLADGDVRALLARVVRTIDNWDGPMVHPFAKLVTPAVRDWLRNQPGGVVPREPTPHMLAWGLITATDDVDPTSQ